MNIARQLLTVGPLGHLRPAPGTWGSLPPVGLVVMMTWIIGPHWTIDGCLVALMLLASVVCVKFGSFAEVEFGCKDPSDVVADETAGQAIALLFLPWRAVHSHDDWWWNLSLAGTAFVLFRLLDITKPPPIHQVQKLHGGWGILVDDLLAGVGALFLGQLLARFVWRGVFS